MDGLATSTELIGQYQEPVALRKRMLHLAEAQFGRDHNITVQAKSDLGPSYQKTGQHLKAAEFRKDLI